MTYALAGLIKKIILGRAHYLARECRRVDGKPTIAWQKYLGRADDIIAALARPAPAPGDRTGPARRSSPTSEPSRSCSTSPGDCD